MSKLFLQIFVLMFVSACFVYADSADDETDAIIGGTTVVKGQQKFMALIIRKKGPKTTLCGGTIVSARHVLTAAHCFEETYDSIDVYVANYNNSPFDTTSIRRKVTDVTETSTDIRKHPQFATGDATNPRINDIAILKLERDLTAAELATVSIVQLSNATLSYAGTTGVALGWGVTKSDVGTPISRTLQQVTLNVQDDDLCDALWEALYVKDKHICTFTSKKAACWGDDGGPLMTSTGVQIGITSFNKAKIADGTKPICERGTGFTRVSNYVAWIKENLLDPIDIITP
uniref:Peptidase S1 domain-containing protein n=1 Tax=Daphnia galeata TaxID=27404 RepID=A0A8J2RFZ6_9CRUS|nr:unnamed protein product [Daphnia galeata]